MGSLGTLLNCNRLSQLWAPSSPCNQQNCDPLKRWWCSVQPPARGRKITIIAGLELGGDKLTFLNEDQSMIATLQHCSTAALQYMASWHHTNIVMVLFVAS